MCLPESRCMWPQQPDFALPNLLPGQATNPPLFLQPRPLQLPRPPPRCTCWRSGCCTECWRSTGTGGTRCAPSAGASPAPPCASSVWPCWRCPRPTPSLRLFQMEQQRRRQQLAGQLMAGRRWPRPWQRCCATTSAPRPACCRHCRRTRSSWRCAWGCAACCLLWVQGSESRGLQSLQLWGPALDPPPLPAAMPDAITSRLDPPPPACRHA